MPQRSHLSLNMGAAGDIGDLVFSKGQSTSHSCVSSHLRAQNSEGPGQPPGCTQPLGSPQSGPAQPSTPPHTATPPWFPECRGVRTWSRTALCWTCWGTALPAPLVPSSPTP